MHGLTRRAGRTAVSLAAGGHSRAARARLASAAVGAAGIVVVGMFAVSPRAYAANGTWTGAGGDFSWATAANWANNLVPGSTDGAAGSSTDLAVFNTPGAGDGTEIIPDANRNVLGIIFDLQVADSGQSIAPTGTTAPIYLTGGGTIQLTAASIPTSSPSIRAPLVIVGNTYSIRNDSTSTSSGLKPSAGISGGVAGAATLTFDGANFGGVLTSNSQVAGPITDGLATHLNVVKNGTGVWDFRASSATPNTYSGDTILNAGAIRFNGTGALSPNSNYIVNEGATFRPSVGGTIHSLTVNSPIGYTVSGETTPRDSLTESGGAIVSINTTSGPGLTLNMSTATGTADFGVPIAFTGTVALNGGIQFVNSDTTPRIVYSKNIDLGTVDRVVQVSSSAVNVTAGDPDLQINGGISGAGGIVKTGPGALKIGGSSSVINNYSGTTTVQQGQLIVAANGFGPVLTGPGGADVSGGRMVFDWTGTTDPSPAIQSILTAGRPGNFATGQIRSSTADSNHGLGWSSDGVSKVTVAYAFYGDANLDQKVDTLDFNSLAANFGGTGKVWTQADFNYDGKVDTLDFNNLAANFGKSLPAPDAAGRALVPEPSAVALLALAGIAGLRRSRRHRRQ